MKKKVLFVASVTFHFRVFHLPYLKWFRDNGFETHTASNGDEQLPFVDRQFQVDFHRSPFSLENIKAYRQLKTIVEQEDYTLVTCHTPMASVVARLVGIATKNAKLKLLYTAHGFHFFNGASILNWMLYYPVELLLSRFTDAIICINHEDFTRIKNSGSPLCDYYLIPGIGVKGDQFFPISREDKTSLRISKGFDPNMKILIYAAEFIPRKNHKFIIEAVRDAISEFDNIKILFAGNGRDMDVLQKQVKTYNVDHIIEFIGYRNDISDIFKLSDVGISSSRQEGLPINVVEGMMTGLPFILSKARGNSEVVTHGVNGFIYDLGDKASFTNAVKKLTNDCKLYEDMSKQSVLDASKFKLENSLNQMVNIYKKYI